jgi:hypothetical protein
MKPRRWLDSAIAIFGVLSFLSLVGIFLASHDIWWDYASPAVWAHAGQSLPDWYSPVNRTLLEWGMMQVGFLLIVIFHVLLFVRYLLRTNDSAPKPTG